MLSVPYNLFLNFEPITEFYEIWDEHYATGGHPNSI
jgi:hypothetical protein